MFSTMIDTHSHILPGIDDGARDFSESLKFLNLAASQGVEIVFATPHSCDGVFDCEKDQILQACADLNKKLKAEDISIEVLPGAEVRVNDDLIVQYDKGNLLTLNNSGTHLLIELPSIFMISAISMMFRQLTERGVTPIIAHAERNPMIMAKPEIISEFIYTGAVIQITAGSLTGEFGKSSMKAARTMVNSGQVFCMGSDIHPGRKYKMSDAKKRLIKLTDKKTAEMITYGNPYTIVDIDERSFIFRQDI